MFGRDSGRWRGGPTFQRRRAVCSTLHSTPRSAYVAHLSTSHLPQTPPHRLGLSRRLTLHTRSTINCIQGEKSPYKYRRYRNIHWYTSLRHRLLRLVDARRLGDEVLQSVCASRWPTLWMCGSTPPPAMVARMRRSSSSSPRIASCRWRGVIRLTRRSLAALPVRQRRITYRTHRQARGPRRSNTP